MVPAEEPAAESALSNPATAQELSQILVIGNAPLAGLGLPLNQIPSNVQTATSADLERQQSLSVADYLNNNFSGISISESQDNPFQPDINYHGFTASPLLGTPEGMSVYVDGVRVNEAFGDTVNWDLIPESAISTVTLMSGSNPVFGLNTLGGALSVQTKSGHDNPGTEIEAYGGSWGRRSVEAETGGASGNFDYFLTGNYFDEDGWRDLSPTKVYQGFGKVGWQNDKTDIDLSYTWADTQMVGNGTTPTSMLDFRRQAIYSAPDFTHNLLNFVNLNGTQFLADNLLLSGNVYYRHLITLSQNGDINDDNYLSDDYSGPDIDCTAPFTARSDAAYCLNGINRASRLEQRTAGFSLQLTDSQDLFGWKNQGIVGVTYDDSNDDYSQMFQYAALTPSRTAISVVDPFNDAETVNSVSGTNKIFGVYLTDTLSPSKLFHITGSLRYNRSVETLGGFSVDTDLGDFGDGWDEQLPLFGDHSFDRVNPAIGFTFTPSDALTFYADYNEASRAPTVIELGCSNPDQPCGLPNDFASDPDLKQVVARTFEAGVRGNILDQELVWSADVFHTNNSNDIQFVATSTSAGYFANVGSTRRQGLDLALGGKEGGFSWHLSYSFVDATYQSTFEINSESNSTADADGNIVVSPGDRIPLIPRHTARLAFDYDFNHSFDIGANVVGATGSFLHGDENNANQVGGTNGEGAFVTGTGSIPSYIVMNMHATYTVNKHFEIFGKVDNVFDRHYTTAGFLSTNVFTPDGTFKADPDDWTNENDVSPGMPRSIWGGVRLRF
ncbi:MAG TPA: TonB-dependent receptor [Steroidobacteraceae bacterium]